MDTIKNCKHQLRRAAVIRHSARNITRNRHKHRRKQ